jgi:putative intracellular protease/amidase
VRRVHATTRFTTSVCTGALLLAAAGGIDMALHAALPRP